MVLLANGKVLTCGNSEFGALGIDQLDMDFFSNTLFLEKESFTAIAAGEKHSILLNADGSVWLSGSLENGKTNYTFEKSSFPANGKKAIKIAAGREFSIILLEDNTVWYCDHSKNVMEFTKISNTPFTSISASHDHYMLLAKDGSVWVGGKNHFGQLGIGSVNNINETIPITCLTLPNDRFAINISAGYGASSIILDNNQVLAFGNCGGKSNFLGFVNPQPELCCPKPMPIDCPITIISEDTFNKIEGELIANVKSGNVKQILETIQLFPTMSKRLLYSQSPQITLIDLIFLNRDKFKNNLKEIHDFYGIKPWLNKLRMEFTSINSPEIFLEFYNKELKPILNYEDSFDILLQQRDLLNSLNIETISEMARDWPKYILANIQKILDDDNIRGIFKGWLLDDSSKAEELIEYSGLSNFIVNGRISLKNESLSLLMFAILYNCACVETIVNQPNIDLNYTSSQGMTALSYAVKNDVFAKEYVEFLLAKAQQLDPNLTKLPNRETPLHEAAARNYPIVIELLMKFPTINVNALTLDGKTPFMIAIEKNTDETAIAILKSELFQPNFIVNGITPIHCAANLGRNNVIKELLLLPSIDPNVICNNRTAFEVAIINKHYSSAMALFESDKVDVYKTVQPSLNSQCIKEFLLHFKSQFMPDAALFDLLTKKIKLPDLMFLPMNEYDVISPKQPSSSSHSANIHHVNLSCNDMLGFYEKLKEMDRSNLELLKEFITANKDLFKDASANDIPLLKSILVLLDFISRDRLRSCLPKIISYAIPELSLSLLSFKTETNDSKNSNQQDNVKSSPSNKKS